MAWYNDIVRTVRTEEDVEAIREVVEGLAEGRYAVRDVGGVDWDDFLFKVEEDADADLGSDMESPAIRKIRRIVRGVLHAAEA